MSWRQTRAVYFRARAGALRELLDLSRGTRVSESAGADAPGSAAGLYRVSRQSSRRSREQDGRGRSAAGVPRPAVPPISELHGVPPEDSRQPCGQESTAMRALLLACLILPAMAQDAKPPETKPADTPEPAASPVPSSESWLTGTIDLGYRWRSDVGGSFDTYRSIVNLGSGPKLLGTEFTVTDPKHRAFDRIDVRAYGWGDEPSSTLHLNARKTKRYDFNGDYRDLAYFNFLPSFADPLLGRGIVLNQQSFDLRRRVGSFQLDLFPGGRLIPYLAYDRNSESGAAAPTFFSGGNT